MISITKPSRKIDRQTSATTNVKCGNWNGQTVIDSTGFSRRQLFFMGKEIGPATGVKPQDLEDLRNLLVEWDE